MREGNLKRRKRKAKRQEIGILNGEDITRLLELLASESITELANDIGIHDRVWRGIRSSGWSRPAAERGMMRRLREKTDVFWTPPIDVAVSEIRNAANLGRLHDQMEPCMTLAWARLRDLDVGTVRFVKDAADLEKDLFGLLYLAAIYFSRRGRTSNSKFQKTEAHERFKVLSGKLLELLTHRPEDDPIASTLRFRIMADRFTADWEAMKREERDSAEWRRRVEDADFFAAMEAYHDIFPCAWQAPWNALSIASRFRMREKYQEL